MSTFTSSARTIARQLRNRVFPGTVILLYHRVATPSRDPQLLAVTPEHFAQQLDVIRRVAPAIRLGDVHRLLRRGAAPRRSVVVTFDDGYADNATAAAPLLTRTGTPATVFVASGMLGRENGFPWDEAASLLDPRDRWNVLEPPNCEAHRQYLAACRGRTSPAPESSTDATDRTLTPDELRSLAANPLMEIGAHTVTHARLATLKLDEQRREIVDSRAQLEMLIGREIDSFSYPFGGRADFSVDSIATVRAAGFACACANIAGTVRSDADLYRLPRRLVRDWDGDTFEQHLREWLGE